MTKEEKYLKSLDYCQNAIDRMARNSFSLKAWFLVSFTALFTFFTKAISGETTYTTVLPDIIWLLPFMVFPILDAYYLLQERMFRLVYKDFAACLNDDDCIRKPFDLKPTDKQRKEFSLINCIFSISIGWLYFPLISALQALIIYHSNCSYKIAWMFFLPLLTILLSLKFKKKTDHQQTN